MDSQFVTTIISASFSIICFLLGIILYMKSDRKGYFGSFCCFAFLSFAAGHIFTALFEAVGENSYYFTLGSFGTVSGLLLIAFACKTVQKVDLPDAENGKKQNLTALAAPAFFVICYIIMLAFRLPVSEMVIATLYLFSALPCAYICLKNTVTHYPEGSMLRCMKPFFITVLVYCTVMMISEVTWIITNEKAALASMYIIIALSCVCYVLMPIFVARGNKKWTQM